MAAVIQSQLRKFEQKAKPYLYEGPFTSYWGFIEQKTNNKVKREHVALGLLGVFVLYLAFGWGNDFLSNLIGFLYPAYASLLSVESNVTGNDTKWLVYWVIFASLGLVEYIGYNFFQTLIFYWLGKTVFLVWLMTPGSTGGSNVLYQRLIRPLVLKANPTVTKNYPEDNVYTTEYSSVVNN